MIESKRFWTIRIYYFLYLGAFGFIMPFLALFFRRTGMSGVQIGILGMVSAIIGIVFAPLWARLGDQLINPRRLLQVAFFGSVIGYLVLSFQNSYTEIALLVGICALLVSGIDPISDSIALRRRKDNQQISFGSIRLWGSLGWAFSVYLAGWMIQELGIRSVFWGYAGLIILVIIVLNFIVQSGIKDDCPVTSSGLSYLRLMKEIIKDNAMVGLALALSVLWLVRSGINQFQAIYMDELGAGESVIGLVNTITALVELPGMLWADHLVNRYGAQQVIRFALFVFIFQMGVIVVFPRVVMFLIAGCLNGIAFSYINVALAVFVSEKAPLTQTATVLALFTSTLRGAIQIFAGLFSGLIFDRFGAYWLYTIGFAGCLLALLIYNMLVINKRRQQVNGGF
jgi:MFS family permease